MNGQAKGLGFSPADDRAVYAEYLALWREDQADGEAVPAVVFNPADDRRIYAEYVAMLAEDEREQEQEQEQPSMESLGLDPTSEFDCEAYAGYLEAEAEMEAAREEAEIERAVFEEEIYLAEHGYTHAWFRQQRELALRIVPVRLWRPLPRRSDHGRRRRTARVRIRSGSRGDPPSGSSDDEPDPPRRPLGRPDVVLHQVAA